MSIRPTIAANFAIDNTTPTTAQVVAFTDTTTATGAYIVNGWAWNFGDGATSNAQNPTHAYASAGKYSVTLTATYSKRWINGTKTKINVVTVAQVNQNNHIYEAGPQ